MTRVRRPRSPEARLRHRSPSCPRVRHLVCGDGERTPTMTAWAKGQSPRTRARDADRDEVCRILDGALAEGQLTGQEHRERVAAATLATTLGELHGSPPTCSRRLRQGSRAAPGGPSRLDTRRRGGRTHRGDRLRRRGTTGSERRSHPRPDSSPNLGPNSPSLPPRPESRLVARTACDRRWSRCRPSSTPSTG